jgi:hypothetical protein
MYLYLSVVGCLLPCFLFLLSIDLLGLVFMYIGIAAGPPLPQSPGHAVYLQKPL